MRRDLLLACAALSACSGDATTASMESTELQRVYMFDSSDYAPDLTDTEGAHVTATYFNEVTVLIPRSFARRKVWPDNIWQHPGPGELVVQVDELSPLDRRENAELLPCTPWRENGQRPATVVSELRSDGIQALCLQSSIHYQNEPDWYVTRLIDRGRWTVRCTVRVPATYAPHALAFLSICGSMKVDTCRAQGDADARTLSPATCLPYRR